ncbi:MAG: hypothetical protein ACI8Z1_003351, partial [Candidatus Azotimanducaceae bacterium]
MKVVLIKIELIKLVLIKNVPASALRKRILWDRSPNYCVRSADQLLARRAGEA